MATSAMPKPVRPMTKLATKTTRAPAAQAAVTAPIIPAVSGDRLATSRPGWRWSDEARLQALQRGVRAQRPGSQRAAGRGPRLRVRADLRPFPPVDGRAGPEPARVERDRRGRPGHAAPRRRHRRDLPHD